MSVLLLNDSPYPSLCCVRLSFHPVQVRPYGVPMAILSLALSVFFVPPLEYCLTAQSTWLMDSIPGPSPAKPGTGTKNIELI